MLHSLEGDLLLSKAAMLAHGVAPGDDFRSGLAAALRDRFPALYKDFRHFCHVQHPKPGGLWLWQGVGEDGRPVRIASLFTQEPPAHEGGHPGRATTAHVNHSLHELKKLVDKEHVASVALPRLATGVGGLSWQHVEPLIRAQLGSLSIPVCIYTKFVPGIAAKEPLADGSAG
jgi:O-acetyl-ADP-ribose deacetylase (regulator of RNase III)